jgi:hypothetical protein
MTKDEQLRWERDNSRWAAITAIVSAILFTAAGLYATNKFQAGADDDAIDQIKLIHDNESAVVISSVVQALGTAFLIAPLYYLFRATRFRRDQFPSSIRYLVFAAPLVSAISSVIHQLQINSAANKVYTQLPLAVDTAKDMIKDEVGKGSLQAIGGLAVAAGLGLAFAFLLVALNAMRSGLLSRVMGVMGIIVGVLVVIPVQSILPFPAIQAYWLAAIGVLILGNWPGGRGPAWASGEAIPWPTAQDRRDAMQAGEPVETRVRKRAAEAVSEPEPVDAEEERAPQLTRAATRPQTASSHPRSKKKKRKRRG